MLRTIWTRVKSFVTLRSLQTRIFLLILVVGILPCILARVAILNNYEERAVEQRSATVSNQLMTVIVILRRQKLSAEVPACIFPVWCSLCCPKLYRMASAA